MLSNYSSAMPRDTPRPAFDALDNPESAYRRIKALQKQYGGESNTDPLNRGAYTYHVILRGPYTGTYELHGNRVTYSTSGVSHDADRILGAVQVAVIGSGTQPPYPDELTVWAAAQVLYVLSEVGGVPLEKVVRDLRTVPKRILSVFIGGPVDGYRVLRLPTQQRDRAIFSKVFLSTWSVEKALKACLPTVEGHVPPEAAIRVGVAGTRALLQGVPSWRQRALAGHDATDVTTRHIGIWVVNAVQLSKVLWGFGLSRAAVRDIFSALYEHEIEMLVDVLWAIPKTLEPLAETLEGRRVIDQAEKKEWRKLLRQHDFVTALYTARGKKPITEAAAAKFHLGSRRFSLPPGVTPLTTRAEFEMEGREMRHCVGGYFWQRQSYCFSIKAPDGCRSTLEWRLGYGAVQHMGEGNTSPSPGCVALAHAMSLLNVPRNT